MAFAVDQIRGDNLAEVRLITRRLAQQPAAVVDQNPSPVEESPWRSFSATGEENDLGRVMAEQFRLPIKRRRLVVLGGFPRNMER